MTTACRCWRWYPERHWWSCCALAIKMSWQRMPMMEMDPTTRDEMRTISSPWVPIRWWYASIDRRRCSWRWTTPVEVMEEPTSCRTSCRWYWWGRRVCTPGYSATFVWVSSSSLTRMAKLHARRCCIVWRRWWTAMVIQARAAWNSIPYIAKCQVSLVKSRTFFIVSQWDGAPTMNQVAESKFDY